MLHEELIHAFLMLREAEEEEARLRDMLLVHAAETGYGRGCVGRLCSASQLEQLLQQALEELRGGGDIKEIYKKYADIMDRQRKKPLLVGMITQMIGREVRAALGYIDDQAVWRAKLRFWDWYNTMLPLEVTPEKALDVARAIINETVEQEQEQTKESRCTRERARKAVEEALRRWREEDGFPETACPEASECQQRAIDDIKAAVMRELVGREFPDPGLIESEAHWLLGKRLSHVTADCNRLCRRGR